MKRRFEIKGANDVATFGEKKKYVSPEIEVVNLDEQPKLLAQSFTGGAGTQGLTNGADWEDD